MAEPLYIRGPRVERQLKPAHLRTGRSILRTLTGIVGVGIIGLVGFAAGYPTGQGGTGAPKVAASAKPAAAEAGNEVRTSSDRTRPDFLAKLASAPASAVAQETSSGLESAALVDKLEAAASVTGSIDAPKKPTRQILPPPARISAAKPPVANKPAPQAAQKQAVLREPSPRPPAPASPKAKPQVAEAKPASGGIAGFFRRPGMSKPVPPPDPAR